MAEKGVREVAEASREFPSMLLVIGAPLRCGDRLLNCAVAIADGRVLCAVPKTFIPNYNEFYEHRWFDSGAGITGTVLGDVPVGQGQLVEVDGVKIGMEICEDLWVPVPPSSSLAMHGAEVMLNLSASDDLIGKYDYLKKLIAQQSARCPTISSANMTI